jgi:Rps23 Pro-64 3,4-dihydroxylase Tpa1-like proline 4-hydroxylase
MNQQDLIKQAEELGSQYRAAEPFPHICLDGLFDEKVLESLLDDFPATQNTSWRKSEEEQRLYQHRKLQLPRVLELSSGTRDFVLRLNSPDFLDFLEKLTGIEGLIPDPYFEGAGLHQIEKGGYLKVHADFNWHKKLKLHRRLNLLLYLNKDWKEEYGGHLEVWDRGMKRCVKRYLPIFNRTIIFNTTDFSYHGHPEPLNCPEERSRRSLSLYYYSSDRPADEISAEHNTLYRARPGEKRVLPLWDYVATRLIPPITLDILRSFRKRNGRS